MMKTIVGIYLGVVLGIVIITTTIFVLLFLGAFSSFQEASNAIYDIRNSEFDFIINPTAVKTTPTPISPQLTVITPVPTSPGSTGAIASRDNKTSTPDEIKPYVNFDLGIISLTGSGYTRTATAQITNTGTIDAHNVRGKVEVFSEGSAVKVNGQDSLNIILGTIKAGKSVTTQVKLSFSLTDGAKIMKYGASFKIMLYSDEKTQIITY